MGTSTDRETGAALGRAAAFMAAALVVTAASLQSAAAMAAATILFVVAACAVDATGESRQTDLPITVATAIGLIAIPGSEGLTQTAFAAMAALCCLSLGAACAKNLEQVCAQ
jgi:hypothetical protein